MKPFTISTVLSITSGRLLAENGMQDVYEILNYMTGHSLFTHQLPRAAEVCGPILLKKFPYLKEIDTEAVSKEMTELPTKEARQEVLFRWAQGVTMDYPVILDVEPLPEGSYDYKGCLVELDEMLAGGQGGAAHPDPDSPSKEKP